LYSARSQAASIFSEKPGSRGAPQQGYNYDDQARHIGRLIVPQIACVDDKRRIVAIPE
jgi:hypothetical protein